MVLINMNMPKFCVREDGWCGQCPMDRVWCAQRFAPVNMTMGEMYEHMTEKLPAWCPCIPTREIIYKKDVLGLLEMMREQHLKNFKETGDVKQEALAELCMYLKKSVREMKIKASR